MKFFDFRKIKTSSRNQNKSKLGGEMKINKDEKGRTLYYVAVDVLLMRDNKFLLQRRANTGWNDGKWNLVGGHIENEENIKQCIIREAKEELNIDIDYTELEIVHCMQHKTDRQTMQFYVACKKWRGTPKIMPELVNGKTVYKADKLDWFTAKDLPEDIIPSAKQAILNFSKGKAFSQIGYELENDYEK